MRARRWALAVVTTAAALLLSSCAAIPTSGDVRLGPTQDPQAPDVVLLPYKPAAGADPATIVQGFVTAATGQQGDYAVAREFLTPALAKTWRPNSRVLVHSDSSTLTKTSDTTMTMTVPVSARLDGDGVYTRSARPRNVSVPFELQRVGGEWRIAKTPNGIVLGQNYFVSLFTSRRISFFDPRFAHLVPDLRWFPAGRTSPTRVVHALLDGPSPAIAAPITASAFPSGATVAPIAPPSSGVATVDLNLPGPAPSALALRRMHLQLLDSLRDLQGIAQVQLSVNGHTKATPPLQAPNIPPDPRALVFRRGSLGYLSGSTFSPEPTLGRSVAAAKPLGMTVSVSQKLAAVRTSSGVLAVTPSSRRLVDGRPGLVNPTLDDRGWIYSVPKDDPQALRAFDARGHRSDVSVTMPSTASVVSIEASRDGTRMLVLVQTANGPSAFVAGVVRDMAGAPIALTTDTYPVGLNAATALAATWVDVDGSSVAVLTGDQSGDSVTVQQLGGVSQTQSRLTSATAIVGGTTVNDLRALLAPRGAIAELQGSVWQPTEPQANASILVVQR